MKKFWIMIAACLSAFSASDADACTGLLVGKKASTDGSVMISYAAIRILCMVSYIDGLLQHGLKVQCFR